MSRLINGDFKYLVNFLNNNNISISQAATIVNRDRSTIRNWLDGTYLSGTLTAIDQTPKQEQRNVAYLISQITGDSKETVLDEIRMYLIEKGKLSIASISVEDAFLDIFSQLKNGVRTYLFGHLMTEQQKQQILTMLSNDLEQLHKL